jgi:hypothetical protein
MRAVSKIKETQGNGSAPLKAQFVSNWNANRCAC